MAAFVPGADARPAAGSCCKFELKECNTVFTCCVCMVDSHEPKRYRCNHCNLARHECCIQLGKNIKINSTSPINWKGKVLELHDKPHIKGKYSSEKKWAKHCMVCGMLIEHYSYHCLNNKGKNINMHPYCVDLITRSKGSSSSTLELKAGVKHDCLWCRRERPIRACTDKFSCWSYLWKTNDRPDRYIHVYCYSRMMIWARKSGVPLENGNNDILKILQKRGKGNGDAGSGWEAIAEEAIGLVLDQLLGGVGGLIPFISWFFR